MKIVPFTADKERHLKFGMNTIIQIEKATGKPVAELLDTVSFEAIRTILFYGLKWEDKKLTEETTGNLFDDAVEHYGDMEELMKPITEALVASFGNKAVPSKK